MNKVLLIGRITRDPEMRSLASGKVVTTFTVATNEFGGDGKEKAEYHAVVVWDRLAEIAVRYLGKGQQIAIENVGVLHAVTADAQQKIGRRTKQRGIDVHVVLDVGCGKDGRARRDPSQ